MEFLSQIANGFADKPLPWMMALMVIALGFLYKSKSDDMKANLEQLNKLHADHRETLGQVLPIADKLTDSIAVLEKIISSSLKD